MDDWSQIHAKYGSLVWATVYRILGNYADSLDCVQDIFVELLERSERQQVCDWPAFLRWLATKRALDRLRRRKTLAGTTGSHGGLETVESSEPLPEAEAAWRRLNERFRAELSKLPEQQAEAFWLSSVEQVTYADIGKQMGIEPNHVGVLIHRARKHLQAACGELNPSIQGRK